MSLRIVSLRCEHREDVPLIGEEAPRFGWVLAATGRDRRQTAYRILVASDAEDLEGEAGSLWDSGKVFSPQTVGVIYAGTPLPPGREVVWTVQVFDEDDAPSSWAEPARFRTGLDAWQAAWIACARPGGLTGDDPALAEDPDSRLEGMQPAGYLRRAFVVGSEPRRAVLYGAARGLVEFELNGRRVGDSALEPGWTDYTKRVPYAAHDVIDLLKPGENVLGAILGDGWFAGYVGDNHKRRGALYGVNPELLCELHVETADGRSWWVGSDERWCGSDRGPIRYSDLLHGERYDARRRFDGWSEAGFDVSEWLPVVTKPLDSVAVVPAKGQPVRVTRELEPVGITEPRPGLQVFDFGQNMSGRTRLHAEGEAGTSVQLRFAEALDEDGLLYRDNLRTAKQTDTFVLAGNGLEVFEPRFTIHGFRYVEVSGLTQTPSPGTLTALAVHSDLPVAGSFSCSEELVNKLYSNIVWTQRSNFVSIPTDCPQRDERLGWAGDAQVFLPTAALNMDVAAFMEKWGDDLIDGQSEEGAYPAVAPRASWLEDGAPGWGDAGIVVPAELLHRYGDLRLVHRHWPHMERFMARLQRRHPDFLREQDHAHEYGDWLAYGEEVSPTLLATAYWARDAKLMAAMAEALRRPERARFYERLAAKVTAAFNAAYVDSDGLVEGDTQSGYLLALGFDLLPPELREKAAARLVANIERRGWHLATGIMGTGLLCPVLTATGYPDVAHRLLTQDTVPSWGYPIRQGATTIWERWDGYTDEAGFQSPLMNSFNQYALGSVGAWLVESVAGIGISEEHSAYEHVVIRPVPGEMTAARATYRSIRGEIASDWSRNEEGFLLAATIPPNVTGTLFVPRLGKTLTESGGDAVRAAGVRSVSTEGDSWRVDVGSGQYLFESA